MKLEFNFKNEFFDYKMPIPVRGKLLTRNEILHVEISEKTKSLESRVISFSPLEDFHSFNVTELRQFIQDFFEQKSISLENFETDLPFFNLIEDSSLSGHYLFVVECILYHFLKLKSPSNFSCPKNFFVRTCALETLSLEQVPHVIKIKITPQNVEEQIQKILNLHKSYPSLKFRFDGNRKFSIEDLVFFLKTLMASCGDKFSKQIEFIEEPLLEISDYQDFYKIFKLPLALDESVKEINDVVALFNSYNFINTLVLKPSLIGISKSIKFIEIARQCRKNCVISSGFEPSSSFEPLLYLSSLQPHVYHGLDTLKYLPEKYTNLDGNFQLTY